MEILWTHEALERLIEIERYISQENPQRALSFIEQLIAHVEGILPDQPRLGRIVPEIGNPDLREVIFKKYRIVYKQHGTTITILTVFEGHRLLRLDELRE